MPKLPRLPNHRAEWKLAFLNLWPWLMGAWAGWMSQVNWLLLNQQATYAKHEVFRHWLGPLLGLLILAVFRWLWRWLLQTRLTLLEVQEIEKRTGWTYTIFLISGFATLGVPLASWHWSLIALGWIALQGIAVPQKMWQWLVQLPWAEGTQGRRVTLTPQKFLWAGQEIWKPSLLAIALLSLGLHLGGAYLSGISNDDLSVYYIRWGRDLLQWGPLAFYQHSNCDYTPLYVYFLGISAVLEKIFQVNDPQFVGLLFKLVPIASHYLLYPLGLSILKQAGLDLGTRPFIWAILIWFNPAFFYISAIWGQSDVPLMCLMLVALWAILAQRLYWILLSAFLGVLFKPQMVFILPFLTAYVFYRFSLWQGLLQSFIAIATGLLVISPFLIGLEWNWLWQFYQQTASVFHLASLNAGTLLGLLAGNWADDRVPVWGGVSYLNLSFAMLAGLMAIFWIRCRHWWQEAHPQVWIYAYTLSCYATFFLSSRMHSRYLAYGLLMLILYGVAYRKEWFWRWGIGLFVSLALFLQMLTHFPMFLWPGFWTPNLEQWISLEVAFYVAAWMSALGFLALLRLGRKMFAKNALSPNSEVFS